MGVSRLLFRMKVRTVAILTLFVLFLKETKTQETQETDETIEVTTGGYVEIAEDPQSCEDVVESYMQTMMNNRFEILTPRIEANVLQQTQKIMTEEIIPYISEQMKEFIRQTVTSEVSQAMSQIQLQPTVEEPIVSQIITDDKVIEIEDRLDKCEELGKLHYVRSCEDLKRQGVSKNGEFYVDPDGNGQGEDPILVSCDFEQGTTSVHHNVTNQTEIP